MNQSITAGAPTFWASFTITLTPRRLTGWAKPTYMTIRLTPALNGTLVELFHHGFEHTGGDVASEHAGYEQGWGMLQLSSLKEVVEGD